MSRRILVSLMVIGLVGVGLGGTTMAMFNDSETSNNNQFTAGELDLRVDWNESYNGEHVETQELTNDPGAIFELGDLKPGDHGEATVSLHLDDNPGWIWMNLNQTSNWDNACTEPEHDAEGQCGSVGELDEELEFIIWSDDGDNIRQEDEHIIFEGTAQELEEQSMSDEGILLDGNPSTNDVEAFEGEETSYIGVKWNLPLETGNHIQGDSVSYDVSFYTEQRRHNDNPDNPWNSDNETEEPENEPPVASFERANGEPFSTTAGNEVRLYSTSTDDDEIVKNKWSMGDDTTKFGVDVWHAWDDPGNYTVSLEVTDSDGETDTASKVMEVTASPSDDTCEEPMNSSKEYTADEISQAKYGYDFEDLSDETKCEVEELFENQPFAEGLTPEDVMTREEISQEKFSTPYDELSSESRSEVDQEYQNQFKDSESSEFTATQGDETIEITPIQGDEPVEELYDFRLPDRYDSEANRNATNGASYPGSGPYYQSVGTEDLQVPETSIMFLYNGPEGLSFVVVHDKSGGDGGSATFEITDLDGNGDWVVKDDLYLDDDGTIASSNYDRWDTNSNPQTIDWTWGGGGTDGGVYSTLSEDFEFTIDPAFNEESELYEQFYNGTIDEWQVLSGDRNNPDRTTLDMDEEVTVAAN